MFDIVIKLKMHLIIELDTIILQLSLVYQYLIFRGVRNSFIYFQPSESDALDRWTFSLWLSVIMMWSFFRNGNWVIQSEMSPSYQLILGKDESQGYPFGRFDWRLGSNTSFCSRPPGGILGEPVFLFACDHYHFVGLLSLTLTSCPSETFTCQTGDF